MDQESAKQTTEKAYKDINISDQTKQYILIKKEIKDLYNHIYDVIVGTYSNEDIGNTIFQKRFSDKISSLEDEVDNFLIDSINEDIEEIK